MEDLFTLVKGDQKINIASGPLTTWRCSAGTLAKTHQIALDNGSFSHIHLSETRDEVEVTLNETGLRPVVWWMIWD